MSKRETLTESMRRYSNIVTEAEQLDEGIGAVLRAIRRLFAKPKSTVLQIDDINQFAKNLEKTLGEDPQQWEGTVKQYFAGLRQEAKDWLTYRGKKLASTGRAYPKPQPGSKEVYGDYEKPGTGWEDDEWFGSYYAYRTLDRQEEVLKNLVQAAARVKQDPTDLNINKVNDIALDALEEVRKSKPAVPFTDAKKHLEAVYMELVDAQDEISRMKYLRRFIAILMVFPFGPLILGAGVTALHGGYGPQED